MTSYESLPAPRNRLSCGRTRFPREPGLPWDSWSQPREQIGSLDAWSKPSDASAAEGTADVVPSSLALERAKDLAQLAGEAGKLFAGGGVQDTRVGGPVPVDDPVSQPHRLLPGDTRSGGAPWLAVRADQGPCPSGAHRLGERADVVGAVVAFAVDEEGGRAGDAAQVGRVHVRGDLGLSGVIAQVASEPFGVQAELAGVADQVFGRQRVLVVQQLVVHLPELALRRLQSPRPHCAQRKL